MKHHLTLRQFAVWTVPLAFAGAAAGGAAGPRTGEGVDADTIAASISSELAPLATPRRVHCRQGEVCYRLEHDGASRSTSDMLTLRGFLSGSVYSPIAVQGHSREYLIPQLLVGVDYSSSPDDPPICGVAVLEPGSGLRFSGVRTLFLDFERTHPHLCGTLEALWYPTPSADAPDRRPLAEVTFRIGARLVSSDGERSDYDEVATMTFSTGLPEMVTDVAHRPLSEKLDRRRVFLKHADGDAPELVWQLDEPDERTLKLPDDLARLVERYPGVVPLSVADDGGHVTFRVKVDDLFSYANVLKSLEEQPDVQDVTSQVDTSADRSVWEVSYARKSP